MEFSIPVSARSCRATILAAAVLFSTACASTNSHQVTPVFNPEAHNIYKLTCESILGELASEPELLAECLEQRYIERKEAQERVDERRHENSLQSKGILEDAASTASILLLDKLLDNLF